MKDPSFNSLKFKKGGKMRVPAIFFRGSGLVTAERSAWFPKNRFSLLFSILAKYL